MSLLFGVAVVGMVAISAVAVGSARATSNLPRSGSQQGLEFWRTHGYLPVDGIDAYNRAKAQSAAWAARQHPGTATFASGSPADPTIGSSWQGIRSGIYTPPDPNGAIGPGSYLEIINSNIAIYQRSGTLVTTTSLSSLTGDFGQLSDPMILWDPHTRRFYYLVWNVTTTNMDWGFSKSANPQTLDDSSWCNYSMYFDYPSGSLPDYPKLGQSKWFVLIGINFYPSFSNLHATHSDVLWIEKPQGSGTVTTCPADATLNRGKFEDLRNQDGSQAFTPVPAIQTDPNDIGAVVSMDDIECPDICGTGNLITVHGVRPKPGDPSTAQLSPPRSVTVADFMSPPDAPQMGTTIKIDTLDGRLTHATGGFDPQFGRMVVWTTHAVQGGAGAEVRWYEIAPGNPAVLLQSGKVTSGGLYIFNAGGSSDRTCTLTQCAHGDAYVVGVSTSSSSRFETTGMVSKIGSAPQSGLVLVKESTGVATTGRWGDYGGATSDPAASMTAAHGEVWLTNEWSSGVDQTWNWEARP